MYQEFGVPSVRSIIKHGLSKEAVEKWDLFWVYFVRQWLPILDSWNVCIEDDRQKSIMNRTNNGLESYNKRFNKLFPDGKPGLIDFVRTVETESRWQATRMDLLRRNNEQEPTYQGVTIPKPPKAYKVFKKSFAKAARKRR